MSRKVNYKQCVLERTQGSSIVSTVAFIPVELASVGRTIEFKEDGQWSGVRWTVALASTLVKSADDFTKSIEQLISGHRKATGDSTKRSNIDGSLTGMFAR